MPQTNELLQLDPIKDASEVRPERAAGLAAKSKELLNVYTKRLEATESELEANLGRHRAEREAAIPSGESVSAEARRLSKQIVEREISKFSSDARRAAVEILSRYGDRAVISSDLGVEWDAIVLGQSAVTQGTAIRVRRRHQEIAEKNFD